MLSNPIETKEVRGGLQLGQAESPPFESNEMIASRRFVRASLTYIPGCVHGLTPGHVACAVSSHEVKRPVIPLLAENKLAYTPLIFRHMQEGDPLCHPKKAYTFRLRQSETTSLFRWHTIINSS